MEGEAEGEEGGGAWFQILYLDGVLHILAVYRAGNISQLFSDPFKLVKADELGSVQQSEVKVGLKYMNIDREYEDVQYFHHKDGHHPQKVSQEVRTEIVLNYGLQVGLVPLVITVGALISGEKVQEHVD